MDYHNTEKAVFVGIIRPHDNERTVMEYLDELQFLAETAGAMGDKKFIQRVDKPDNATYIRSGKLEEIAQYCEENQINYVIFDDELSPMQQRNIERVIKTTAVIDRTSLILEIFAQRAKTSYAKMQVELARYNYMLPRLAGMWTHLERQRGGVGTRGGMGETQIEVDRRIVKEKISRLKEQLKKVDRQMATQRGNRGSLVRLSLVGYTNVGKSTLIRLILGLLTPSEGSILVGGKAAGAALRGNFMYIPQGNSLLSGTIRSNLQLASPDATEDEMRSVLETAMAQFVFELPDGLDTPCGEVGSGLSEGQCQRIAIARGLLRPGGIMILDESTSALDAATEEALLQNLYVKYHQRKTIIFISHRKAAARFADAVIEVSQ